MSERLGIAPETLQQEQKPQVFFISAARGTYDGLRTINRTLGDKFGEENVHMYNSALFGEHVSPHRFKKMGAQMKAKIEAGPTTILAHSFGAAETMAAFEEIEKEDPDFFKKKEHLENLTLTLISPAGFIENWRQGLKYVAKYAQLGAQEVGMLGRTFPGRTSVLQGISSVASIPSGIAERSHMVAGIRSVSADISNADGTARVVEHNPDRDYLPYVNEADLETINQLDARIAEASEAEELTRKERRTVRKALRQRGRLTSKVVMGTLMNSYSDEAGDPVIESEKFGKSKEASQARRKLIIDTFVKGKVLSKMTELQDAGVNINIVVPEHDTMMTVDDARNFLQGREDRLAVTSLSTHMVPWAAQPNILVELVKTFDRQNPKES
jgi:hypothetical protein